MDIAFSKIGNGTKNLIFIHGYCERKEMWSDFIPYLGAVLKSHTIYLIDLPGFGESPIHSSIKSLEAVSDVVYQFTKEQSISSADWVGHSLGGYVLMALQYNHPEVFRGLCMFHSSIFADKKDKKEQRNKVIDFINKYGKEKFITEFFPGLFHPKNVLKLDSIINKTIEQGLTTDINSMIRYMEMMRDRDDLSESIRDSTFPIHFIAGKEDQSVTLKTSRKQIKLANNSTGKILSECAHMGMFERPKKASESLLQFLQSH